MFPRLDLANSVEWRHRTYCPPGVDTVINSVWIGRFEPFDIGTEARVTAEIKCEMYAEAAVDRRGIDQMPERRTARIGAAGPFRQTQGRRAREQFPVYGGSYGMRVQTRCYDQISRVVTTRLPGGARTSNSKPPEAIWLPPTTR